MMLLFGCTLTTLTLCLPDLPFSNCQTGTRVTIKTALEFVVNYLENGDVTSIGQEA